MRGLWDNIKCTNIYIIGIAEGEEIEQGIENLFQEIMAENLPNLVKKTYKSKKQSLKQNEPKESHTKTHHN